MLLGLIIGAFQGEKREFCCFRVIEEGLLLLRYTRYSIQVGMEHVQYIAGGGTLLKHYVWVGGVWGCGKGFIS